MVVTLGISSLDAYNLNKVASAKNKQNEEPEVLLCYILKAIQNYQDYTMTSLCSFKVLGTYKSII